MMLFRTLLAFIALPGIFAGLIPSQIVLYDPYRDNGHFAGALIILCGLAILSLCIRDFLISGRGTLAPWDPPRYLVIVGLYRYSRNPMYIGIIIILAGWAYYSGSPLLVTYSLLLATAFYLRVVFGEELTLAKQFGNEWSNYVKKVPRWLPRLSSLISLFRRH